MFKESRMMLRAVGLSWLTLVAAAGAHADPGGTCFQGACHSGSWCTDQCSVEAPAGTIWMSCETFTNGQCCRIDEEDVELLGRHINFFVKETTLRQLYRVCPGGGREPLGTICVERTVGICVLPNCCEQWRCFGQDGC